MIRRSPTHCDVGAGGAFEEFLEGVAVGIGCVPARSCARWDGHRSSSVASPLPSVALANVGRRLRFDGVVGHAGRSQAFADDALLLS